MKIWRVEFCKATSKGQPTLGASIIILSKYIDKYAFTCRLIFYGTDVTTHFIKVLFCKLTVCGAVSFKSKRATLQSGFYGGVIKKLLSKNTGWCCPPDFGRFADFLADWDLRFRQLRSCIFLAFSVSYSLIIIF